MNQNDGVRVVSNTPSSLSDLPARTLVKMMRAGEASAREVVTDHLARIDAWNPQVNAVVSMDAEGALREADAADALRAAGEPVSALHGLPISFKDTASTVGFPTTFGSLRYVNNIAKADDLHVARIRRAGAIRIGKTNIPEQASGSHTFNRVFGPTRNPHDLRVSAGGSSGGGAAALAAGFQPIADGSDMGGSLRNPAAFCGVVGMRPSPGVVPNTARNALSHLTVTGPMARTVEDVALLLSVMAGASPNDPLSYAVPEIGESVVPTSLRRIRVAIAPTLGGLLTVDSEITERVAAVAGALEAGGALVEEAVPDLHGSVEVFRTLRAAEFFTEFGEDMDAGREEFVDFVARNIEEGRDLSATDVIRAQCRQSELLRTAVGFFGEYDLLISPTTAVLPFPIEQRYPTQIDGVAQDDYLSWMTACLALTPLGLPSLSLPAGFSGAGLPIGVQLTAGPRQDNRLLNLAQAVSELLPAPRVPSQIGNHS